MSNDTATRSAYDLISEEDRETLRWVRDQGGLRPVQNEVSNYATLCRSIQDADNRRIEMCSILGIDVDTGWSDACEELRNRLIPESYEWPRYEDGDPVKLGDMALIDGELDMVEQVSLTIQHQPVIVGDGGSQQLARGERVKRPTVLAADGKPLRVGETVWDTNGDELIVGALEDGGHTVTCRYVDVGDGIPVHGMWSPSDLTHERPVLDADGVPIKVGDTVYFTDGREQECNTVVHAKYDYKDEPYVQLGRLNDVGYPTYTNCSCIDPSQLTHTKPEPPDSWERLEEDAKLSLCEYNLRHKPAVGNGTTLGEDVRVDLVRRARALAGVSE